MTDIVLEGVDDLYNRIVGKPVDAVRHGPLAAFYSRMSILRDPNACSCKKGKAAQDNIMRMYMSMPVAIRVEPLRSAARELLGEGTIVFKVNGIEFARLT